ncbi:MAG: Hsp20/alpha crystallin family protein [Bacteroidales bacterium]
MNFLRTRNYTPGWSLFDEFLNGFEANDYRRMALDIIENENEFIIKADLPGFDKKDIKVSVNNNQLTIEAEKKVENKVENETIHKEERFSGKYMRTLSLPENCSADNISAKLENGVLDLIIKKTMVEPAKQITIE